MSLATNAPAEVPEPLDVPRVSVATVEDCASSVDAPVTNNTTPVSSGSSAVTFLPTLWDDTKLPTPAPDVLDDDDNTAASRLTPIECFSSSPTETLSPAWINHITPTPIEFPDNPCAQVDAAADVTCTNLWECLHHCQEFTPSNPSPISFKTALGHEVTSN